MVEGPVSFEYVILYYFAAALVWVLVGSLILEAIRRYVVRKYPPKPLGMNADPLGNYDLPETEAANAAAATDGPDPEQGTSQPKPQKSGVSHEAQEDFDWFFCYSCAADRPSNTVDIKASKAEPERKYKAKECDMCGDLLHHENWLPKLVNFMDDYKQSLVADVKDKIPEIEELEINPDFPIHQFASFSERLSLLFTYGSAGFNVFAIVNKFIVTINDGRQESEMYNLVKYVLTLAEFSLVGAFVLFYLFKSFRYVKVRPRKHAFVVWLGIVMTYIPNLGKANALWAIRFWDVDALVEILYHSAYLNYSGPACWSTLVKLIFVLIRLPILILFIFFPALGIFCRLLEVDVVIRKYISDWGYMDWITFLAFVNNFRYIADKLSTVMQLGVHLYGTKVYYLYADILDANPASVFSIATLVTTTGPAELYEMTKHKSRLWKHNIIEERSTSPPSIPTKSPPAPARRVSGGKQEPLDLPSSVPGALNTSEPAARLPHTSSDNDETSPSTSPPVLPDAPPPTIPCNALAEALVADGTDETVVPSNRARRTVANATSSGGGESPGGRPQVPLRRPSVAPSNSSSTRRRTNLKQQKEAGGVLALSWITGSFSKKPTAAHRRK